MRPPLAAIVVFVTLISPVLAQPKPHNVILFVADGLRPGMVNEQTAPAMAALLARGVRFTNTHSLFPTFTTANASGMATGHLLGAAGAIEAIYAIKSVNEQVVPPTLNLDEPDEGCDIDLVPKQAKQRKVRYALSNSFGFGGTNACLIVGAV